MYSLSSSSVVKNHVVYEAVPIFDPREVVFEVEKIDGVSLLRWVELGHVKRVPSFSFIVVITEDVEGDVYLAFDFLELGELDWVLDLVETEFSEHLSGVINWTLRVIGLCDALRESSGADRVTEASIVIVLDVDDASLFLQEGREVLVSRTSFWRPPSAHDFKCKEVDAVED